MYETCTQHPSRLREIDTAAECAQAATEIAAINGFGVGAMPASGGHALGFRCLLDGIGALAWTNLTTDAVVYVCASETTTTPSPPQPPERPPLSPITEAIDENGYAPSTQIQSLARGGGGGTATYIDVAVTSNDGTVSRTDLAYVDTGACGYMCAHGDWIRSSIYHGTRTCKRLVHVRRAQADSDVC